MAASIGRGKALKNRKLEAPRPKRQSSLSSGNVSQTSSESQSLLEQVYNTVDSDLDVHRLQDTVLSVQQNTQVLQACQPDDLEVVLTTVRRRLSDPDLAPLVHMSLLQLLELMGTRGVLPQATRQYYSSKQGEVERQQLYFQVKIKTNSGGTSRRQSLTHVENPVSSARLLRRRSKSVGVPRDCHTNSGHNSISDSRRYRDESLGRHRHSDSTYHTQDLSEKRVSYCPNTSMPLDWRRRGTDVDSGCEMWRPKRVSFDSYEAVEGSDRGRFVQREIDREYSQTRENYRSDHRREAYTVRSGHRNVSFEGVDKIATIPSSEVHSSGRESRYRSRSGSDWSDENVCYEKHFKPRERPESQSTPTVQRVRRPEYMRQHTSPAVLGGSVSSAESPVQSWNSNIIPDFKLILRKSRYSQGCYQYDVEVQGSDLDIRRVLPSEKVSEVKRATDTNIVLHIQDCSDRHLLNIIGPSEATVAKALKCLEDLMSTSTVTSKTNLRSPALSSPRSPEVDFDLDPYPSPLFPGQASPASEIHPTRIGRGRGSRQNSMEKQKELNNHTELNPQAKSYIARVLAHETMFNSSDDGLQLSDLACRRSRTSSGSTSSSHVTEESVAKATVEDVKSANTGAGITEKPVQRNRGSSSKSYRDFDVVREEVKDDYIQAWGQQVERRRRDTLRARLLRRNSLRRGESLSEDRNTSDVDSMSDIYSDVSSSDTNEVCSSKKRSSHRQSSLESDLRSNDNQSSTEPTEREGVCEGKESDASEATFSERKLKPETADIGIGVNIRQAGDIGTSNGILIEWLAVKGSRVKIEGPTDIVKEIMTILKSYYSEESSKSKDTHLTRNKTPPGFGVLHSGLARSSSTSCESPTIDGVFKVDSLDEVKVGEKGKTPNEVQGQSSRGKQEVECLKNERLSYDGTDDTDLTSAIKSGKQAEAETRIVIKTEPLDFEYAGGNSEHGQQTIGSDVSRVVKVEIGVESEKGKTGVESRTDIKMGEMSGESFGSQTEHVACVKTEMKSVKTPVTEPKEKNRTDKDTGSAVGVKTSEKAKAEMTTKQEKVKKDKTKKASKQVTEGQKQKKSGSSDKTVENARLSTESEERSGGESDSDDELLDEFDEEFFMEEIQKELMKGKSKMVNKVPSKVHKCSDHHLSECQVLKPFSMQVTNKYQSLETKMSPPRISEIQTTSTPVQTSKLTTTAKHSQKAKTTQSPPSEDTSKVGAAISKPITISQQNGLEGVSESKSYSEEGSVDAVAPLTKSQKKRQKKKKSKAKQMSTGSNSDIDLEGLVRGNMEESYASLGTTKSSSSLTGGTMETVEESDGTAIQSSSTELSSSDSELWAHLLRFVKDVAQGYYAPSRRKPLHPYSCICEIEDAELGVSQGKYSAYARRRNFVQEPLKEMMWPESPDWARCFVDGVVAVEMAVVRLVGEVYKDPEPPMGRSHGLDRLADEEHRISQKDTGVAYGRAFLLACAKSPHSQKEPPQWEYFSQVVPEICCKNVDGFFDPDMYQTPSRDTVRVSRRTDVCRMFDQSDLPQSMS